MSRPQDFLGAFLLGTFIRLASQPGKAHRGDMSVTYFAKTNFRNQGKRVGIKQRDRLSHMYIIGKTGTGKSTLLKTLIAQDIASGQGCALLDPHGDLVEDVVALVPPERRDDLVHLNTPEPREPWHFNPLADVPPDQRSLAVAGMVDVFKKIWSDDWGPRLEHVLRNVLFALLEWPGASLGHIPRLLVDRKARARVVVPGDEPCRAPILGDGVRTVLAWLSICRGRSTPEQTRCRTHRPAT